METAIASLEDLVWSREETLLLEQLFATLTELMTEYLRNGFQLAGEDFRHPIVQTFPFWCSLTSSQKTSILERFQVTDYRQLMSDSTLGGPQQQEILQQWIVHQALELRSCFELNSLGAS